jgi:hypothetical protein
MVAGILGGCEAAIALASERTMLAREPIKIEGFIIDSYGRVC